ncbi:MAG TPA: NepR family anti-sigma factor [Caulobacteraceae bacterium]|jgi:hypothetical protein|nr:NepR family anti-sigma factor [Caulobacteraceae bacterium]
MTKAPKEPGASDDARLRQQAIGARLRQIFDAVVNEPVPDDFLDILRRAEAGGRPASEAAKPPTSPHAGGGASDK